MSTQTREILHFVDGGHGLSVSGAGEMSIGQQKLSSHVPAQLQRLYNLLDMLDKESLALQDRMDSALTPLATEKIPIPDAKDSISMRMCSLAESMAQLANRLEGIYGRLINLRERIEL